MKILVISQFYTPDITAAAFRICESVDLLRAQGHDVKVITSHPHKALAAGDGVDRSEGDVYRVELASAQGGGMRRYLQHYMSFVWRSSLKGLKLRFGTWRPDIIWTTSPPLFVGMTGYFLAKIWRCPLVLDIRDIWPESAVAAEQLSGDGKAFKIGKGLERQLYKRADHLTCVSAPMADYIKQQTATPVTVVYNGVLSKAASTAKLSDPKKRILYAGNLGRVQGLDIIIKAFAKARSKGLFKDFTLEFIGAGAFEERLRALVEEVGVSDRVIFHSPVKKEQIFDELRDAAVLFINLKGDKVFALTIPSKVFDYMIVNRPILSGVLGEGNDVMGQSGGNVAFTPGNEDELLQALEQLDAHYPELAQKAQGNAQIVLGNYSREQAVATLLSVFEKLKAKK